MRRKRVNRIFSPTWLCTHANGALFCVPESRQGVQVTSRAARGPPGTGAGQVLWVLELSKLTSEAEGHRVEGRGGHLQSSWKSRVFKLCRVEKCLLSSYYKVSCILFIYLVGRACIPGIFGWFVLLFFVCVTFFFSLKEARPPCRSVTSL